MPTYSEKRCTKKHFREKGLLLLNRRLSLLAKMALGAQYFFPRDIP
jgi:hypothetical protein